MGWSASHIFRQWIADSLTRTSTPNYGTDVPKVALYGNAVTPDENVTAALSAYNAGQWATANEVFQAGQWAQGGVALSGISGTSHSADTADAVWYDAAAQTASAVSAKCDVPLIPDSAT